MGTGGVQGRGQRTTNWRFSPDRTESFPVLGWGSNKRGRVFVIFQRMAWFFGVFEIIRAKANMLMGRAGRFFGFPTKTSGPGLLCG
jgi:hypothetical protein